MKTTVKKAYGVASKTVELSLVDVMAINDAKRQIDIILSKDENYSTQNVELINALRAMKNLLTRLGIEELNLQPSDIFDDIKESLVENESYEK